MVAVDDGAFRRRQRWAPVIGVVFSTPDRIEGVLRARVRVDGTDATDRISDMLTRAPHLEGVRAILVDGVCFGGFNVLDLDRLAVRTGRPVIALTRRTPDFRRIRAALRQWFPRDHAARYRRLSAHRLFRVRTPVTPIWAAVAGCPRRDAAVLVARTTTVGSWPEPLRVAHLIGHAWGSPLPRLARRVRRGGKAAARGGNGPGRSAVPGTNRSGKPKRRPRRSATRMSAAVRSRRSAARTR
ncbi:MAG: DUF99 family protein [Thermoplasmata archaeon]